MLPFLTRLARLAIHTIYRFEVGGAGVPPTGPLIIVSNHGNHIADPAAVLIVARRPIRFLGKAPFFENPLTRWFVRGAGAIPVYRRKDDPSRVDRNEETFRIVKDELAKGAAIGIYPEGMSHNEPAILPLRTGTARIALGAARLTDAPIRIVPIGVFYRHKTRFRSPGMAMVGTPIPWDDLRGRAEDDADAVRELTARIEEGLRQATVSLETWEDAQAVDVAESVYAAEFELEKDPEQRHERFRQVAGALARLRSKDPDRIEPILESVLRFSKVLGDLRLRPEDLHLAPRPRTVWKWIARRSIFFLLATPVVVVGLILFYLPYLATAWIERLLRLSPEVRVTYKIFGGGVIFILWIALLSTLIGLDSRALFGVIAALVLPLFALATLVLVERWREAFLEARTYLVLRQRSSLRDRLLERRRAIARELEGLRKELR
ncbi:MAG TPA: 1-acyl-sn-glycerol-3-phosphate acyltransferase [Thermoanaerobaculia bacterium]